MRRYFRILVLFNIITNGAGASAWCGLGFRLRGYATVLIGFLLALLLGEKSYASIAHLARFQYETTAAFADPSRGFATLLLIRSGLEDLGVLGLKQVDAGTRGSLQGAPVDQFYTDAAGRKMVLVKLGLRPLRPELLGRVLMGPGFRLYHGDTISGQPVAVAMVNLTDSESEDVVLSLPVRQRRFSVLSTVVSQARAEVGSVGLRPEARSAEATQAPAGVQTAVQLITRCAGQAGQGFASAAQSTVDTARRLLSDPWSFWTSAVSSARELVAMAGNIREELQGLMATLRELDTDTAIQAACGLVGQSAFAGLLAATGVGGARAVAQLAQTLERLRSARSLANGLARAQRDGLLDPGSSRRLLNAGVLCAAR